MTNTGIKLNRAETALWEYSCRPNTIQKCVLPIRLKTFFQGIVDSRKLPNLLLCSQKPGTGKTTVGLALANELDMDCMFINASVENGIDLARTKIPNFCRQRSISNKPKCIILDEADNLSADAQKALRGCIDEYSQSVRFILTCNYKQNISDPLQSRFTTIDFIYGDVEVRECMKQSILMYVELLKEKGVKLSSPKVIAELVKQHAPNNRSVIIALQQYSMNGAEIDEGVLSQVKTHTGIDDIVEAIKNKQFKTLRDFSEKHSDNADDILGDLYDGLLAQITSNSIVPLLEALGESNREMPTVVNKSIELQYLLVQLMLTLTFK